MKKLLCAVLAFTAVCCFAGCVDHTDGICDHKDCDVKLGVVQYEKDVELCVKHAIEKYGQDYVNSFKSENK